MCFEVAVLYGMSRGTTLFCCQPSLPGLGVLLYAIIRVAIPFLSVAHAFH